MKTLLLNPPSFQNFDGGAGSRWPATREITSFWYPVWLCYPAGMIKTSRVLDAPSHGFGAKETLDIARDYDFVVIFTSTPGFKRDVQLAEMLKGARPATWIAFVGPHVSVLPEESLKTSFAIDFVARREFDLSVYEFAQGRKLSEIAGISYRKNGAIVHNPDRHPIADLDSLPWVTPVYHRDLDITRYNVPFLMHPYIAFYTGRGCSSRCTFCLWPQTFSGHAFRTRSAEDVAREVEGALKLFPKVKEIFFDDDTFACRKARVLELCKKLAPLSFTWSCNSRVSVDYDTLKAMKEAGCRLLIVGYESGNPTILKNIKKGTTVEQAHRFTRDAKKLGLLIHGDFIVGLPGENWETVRETIKFAKELDPETIQVSVAHAFPGTALHDELRSQGRFTNEEMTDEEGHQLANFQYSGLSSREMLKAVEEFYGQYYFRPRVIWRIVARAIFDAGERKRLYRQAREYLKLRTKRKKLIKMGAAQRPHP